MNKNLPRLTLALKKLNCVSITGLAFAACLLALSQAKAAPGDFFEIDSGASALNRITPAGTRISYATGITSPRDLAFDSADNLYVGEFGGSTIVKFTASGTKSTFASVFDPYGIAIDSNNNLYVAEGIAGTIVKISPNGTKTPFASGFNFATGLAFDQNGVLFAGDFGGGGGGNLGKVWRVESNGTKTVFASDFYFPIGLAFDPSGNLFVSDLGGSGQQSGSITKITPTGVKTTFASSLSSPWGLSFDAGLLFAAESGANRIVKFTPAGVKTTFVSGLNEPKGLALQTPTAFSLNIATRLRVQSGDNVLIAGFIITGDNPKQIIIRGIGPSLSGAGVAGALQDPVLELRNASGLIASNDDWKQNQQAVQNTGIPPSDDREAAIVTTLGPGSYTAIERGKNGGTGIGVVEVYDLNQASKSELANISTRGFVETGNNVMIGGFIIGSGNGSAKIIARAIGPSLGTAGVAGALADPTLELRNASGAVVASNDDWRATQQTEIEATGIPPQNNRESAVVALLPAGNYTAIVAGFNGATGVGLVEIYNLQ